MQLAFRCPIASVAPMGRATGSLRRGAVASVVVAAFLLAPAAATAARPHWQKPQIVVPVGTATYNPVVATGRDGTTVVAWDEANPQNGTFELMFAARTPSGAVSNSRKLGPMTGAFPQAALAVGGDGTFAVAWGYRARHNKNRAAVRIWRPGKKGFGKTELLSPGNVSTDLSGGDTPQVAVDDAGTVYVVWEGLFKYQGAKHYQVVIRKLGRHARRWSKPQRLSSIKTDSHSARVAADGAGNAAVCWTETSGAVRASILRSGQKRFHKAQRITPATYGVSPPSIAESDSGKVAIVWEQSVKAGRRIESKVTTGAKFPRASQNLSAGGAAQFESIALASNGGGVTAWERLAGSGGQVQVRTTAGSSTKWGNIKQLTRPGVALFGTGPAVAAANGRAFVAWTQRVNNKLSVGVGVLLGKRWQKTRTYAALGSAVVSAANDPVKGTKVLGAVVWPTIDGLKLAVYGR